MVKRLGLDIGTNSIGWCLIEDDTRIVDIGVRIFSDGRDPQSGASLAVDRRDARSARRRRDRYLGRRSAFFDALVVHGLMPADSDEAKLIAERDPYAIRARALDERLEPYEIGRALFHLNQRRGFKSNRKAERKVKDGEDGKIRQGEKELDRAMMESGTETLGQFLLKQDVKRVRMSSANQTYDFYPQRRHVEYEFDEIWKAQTKHHFGLLSDVARDDLKRILFFQRPLKEQKVGLCLFAGMPGVPGDECRLPRAHPLFQERRLYEEVNQLRITTPGAIDIPLSYDQREKLILKLRGVKSASFESLGKLLKLEPGQSFNKASATRTTLAGNEVFATMGHKSRFGDRWVHLDRTRQWEIVQRVMDEEDPDKLHTFLTEDCGLDDAHAEATAKASLPELYGRLGETATARILDELKQEVITYDTAVERCGWHHSDLRTGEILPQLPYYGELLTREIPPGTQDPNDPPEKRWGKITNPTVHIGLRQLEKLVNQIIKVHGRPDQIVVELARELKLNEKDKEEHNRRIRKDTAAAIARGKKLSGLDDEGNQVGERIADDTGANRMLLRMWEELNPSNPLDRRCPYCAKPINIHMLFDAEGGADIDHIIPYSRSLDDSVGNKVVAHRACNRAKGNLTPWEKWGDTEHWEVITDQVSRMHKSKQWRFGPDAMARVDKDGGFIARQLTDTQYLSRLAGVYLSSLYPESGKGSRHVFMSTGRMTAMLRRLWALNDVLKDHRFVENKNSNAPKNRLDHRHHAIDAFVMAVLSPALIARIAEAAGRAENKDLDRMFEGLPEPWPGYLVELKSRLDATTVSHKPDHGRRGRPAPGKDVTAGRLHNDTAYGFTGDLAADGKTPIVVHRIPIMSIKPADLTNPDRIADPVLRDELFKATRGLDGKAFLNALEEFRKKGSDRIDKNGDRTFEGTRHIRVREPLAVIPIHDANGKAYKAHKGDSNARFDVWRLPDGKWVYDVISTFRAHQREAGDQRPHPAAKKVLSLRQNDMLAIEREGEGRSLLRITGFNAQGRLTLAPANEGGALKARDAASNDADPFKYTYLSVGSLKKLKARQVRIDPLGRIFDPGPR